MGTEYPETIYYYAVRDPGRYYPYPRHTAALSLVKEWNILFIIQSYSTHHEGHFFVPDDYGVDQLFYLHYLDEENYDLLDAFGVPAVTGFVTKCWRIPPEILIKDAIVK